MTIEGGWTRSADKSFLGRVIASRLYQEALTQEHLAAEDKVNYAYGHVVTRLHKAVGLAREAVEQAEQHNVPKEEMRGVGDGLARLEASYKVAVSENAIYQENVPDFAALPSPEPKAVVKPLPLEIPVPAAPDPFHQLLPESIRTAVDAHHGAVHGILHELSSTLSREAGATQARTTCRMHMHMPHPLSREAGATQARLQQLRNTLPSPPPLPSELRLPSNPLPPPLPPPFPCLPTPPHARPGTHTCTATALGIHRSGAGARPATHAHAHAPAIGDLPPATCHVPPHANRTCHLFAGAVAGARPAT